MLGKRSSFIHSLACALPDAQILQDAAAAHLADRVDIRPRLLERLYRVAGVDRRYSVLGKLDELYADDDPRPPTTAARMAAYESYAAPLAICAARRALDSAQIQPSALTHLVVASCTGFNAPGVEHAIIKALGLNPTISRTQIGFMGCHAALNAISVASSFAQAHDATVLVVCVELCSLHLQYSNSPELLVANSLFSDGAAAFLCSSSRSDTSCFELLSRYSQILPQTSGLMSWRIRDHGFEMTLSNLLPSILAAQLPSILEAWSLKHSWQLDEVDGWAVHPGGPRLLGACESVLGQLNLSRQVLRECGNMSAPTVLFILEQLAQSQGTYGMIAFGPGVCFEGALIRRL